MSRQNGDKARFGKEQQKKLLRRKQTLAVRQSLASKAADLPASEPITPTAPNTAPDSNDAEPASQ